MQVEAVDRRGIPTLEMPSRFRTEVVFFITPAGERGAPVLPDGEYWIDQEEARRWLDEQIIRVVSPLDAENMAEIELTDYHEAFLEWVVKHQVSRVRFV